MIMKQNVYWKIVHRITRDYCVEFSRGCRRLSSKILDGRSSILESPHSLAHTGTRLERLVVGLTLTDLQPVLYTFVSPTANSPYYWVSAVLPAACTRLLKRPFCYSEPYRIYHNTILLYYKFTIFQSRVFCFLAWRNKTLLFRFFIYSIRSYILL